MSSQVETMGRSKKSRREVELSSAGTPATPEPVAVVEDCPVKGCDTLALDDLSVSRLRKFFELLDRWDRQESASNPA
jgi:hypothetical protein